MLISTKFTCNQPDLQIYLPSKTMSFSMHKAHSGVSICPGCDRTFTNAFSCIGHYNDTHLGMDDISPLSSPDSAWKEPLSPVAVDKTDVPWIETTSPELGDGRKYLERVDQMMIQGARTSTPVVKSRKPKTCKRLPLFSDEEERTPTKAKRVSSNSSIKSHKCKSCGKYFPTVDDVKHHVIGEHLDDLLGTPIKKSASQVITISSEDGSFHSASNVTSADSTTSDDLPALLDDTSIIDADSSSDEITSSPKRNQVSASSVAVPEMCSDCDGILPHFHIGGPLKFQEAYMVMNNPHLTSICEVPVNMKRSKCFLLDKDKLPHKGDFNCDDMPWLYQKGSVTKGYFVKFDENGKPHKSWPMSDGPGSGGKLVHVKKTVLKHKLEKKASKIIYEVVDSPVILIQYQGLDNQAGLKISKKRHTRPSTVDQIKDELKSSKSCKRVRYNVGSKIKLEGPSSLPKQCTVKNVKAQENSKSSADSVTQVMHMMADSSYIRSHNVSGNVVSVVCFTDRQLQDIERFCCNESFPCSSLHLDTTFKFGKFYVVTTMYRNLFLKYKGADNCPCMMGPMMITHNLKRVTYRVLLDSLTQASPQMKENVKAYLTDGEEALAQACSESFTYATGLLCLTHIEKNIREHVKHKLKLSDKFTNHVLQDISGNKTQKGLTHCKTYTEYTQCLESLYEKWDQLEMQEYPMRQPRFTAYFRKNKQQDLYDRCRVQLAEDVGLVDCLPDNNGIESIHAIMRRWQSFKSTDIATFITDMHALQEAQQRDVLNAFKGLDSPYTVREQYQTHIISEELLFGESKNPSKVGEKIQKLHKLQVLPAQREVYNSQKSHGSPPQGHTPLRSLDSEINLDDLVGIPQQERATIIRKWKDLHGTQGFAPNTFIFRKSSETFVESCRINNKYKCPCHTNAAYSLCQHTLYHANRDGKLHDLIRSVQQQPQLKPFAIANFKGNKRAGQKTGQAPRVRQGRAVGDDRLELIDVLPKLPGNQATPSTLSKYDVTSSQDLKMKISRTDNGSGVKRRPDKPDVPPTLGVPFIVRKVRGNISVCFGCRGSLQSDGLCVAHVQSDYFWNKHSERWQRTQTRKHFHLNERCIREGNNPGFKEDMLEHEDTVN